jgi:hypothetical protein
MRELKEQVPETGNEDLRAEHVRSATGLSYRQLNDWDAKGVLPGNRQDKTSWRRFSFKELFALLICSEIRKRFGVPLESLRWVQSFMLQEGPNHYQAAVELIAHYGFSVWLLTDLKGTFVMDSDLELEDMFSLGYFRTGVIGGYILLEVNPLVNRILACLKNPIELKTSFKTYKVVNDVRRQCSAQGREIDLLSHVRERNSQKLTVHVKDGVITHFDREEELATGKAVKEKNILSALKESDFLTVTAVKRDGKIVRINRKTPIKFPKVTGKT